MARSYTVELADGSFDPAKYKLGNVCRRGHQYAGTGKGLRYIKGSECVVCARERSGRLDPRVATERVQACHRRNGRPSRGRHTTGVRLPVGVPTGNNLIKLADMGLLTGDALAAADESRVQAALRAALNSPGPPSVARLVMDEQRAYWADHPEAERMAKAEHNKHYQRFRYMTDASYRLYVRQKTRRRKAIERGSIGVQAKGSQIRARFEQFGNCCAYCGSTENVQIEHLVPIARGGTHVLGNILPACRRCNYSKKARDAEQWYRAQPWFSETRWRRIRQVLGIGRGHSAQLALL